MDINKQYAWQSGANSRENNPLLPRNLRGQQSSSTGWINHLYVFGKSIYQQEYKVLQKGFEAGLNKQHISNVFANKEALRVANISPLTAIDTFNGARNVKIKSNFYDDCQNIPDPSALDPMQNNLLCWTIASWEIRIKPKRTTLEVDTATVIRYTLHRTTRCKESNTYPR